MGFSGDLDKLAFITQVDTLTGVGAGTTVDTSNEPLKYFSLSVRATGAVVTWTVLLEGSLDGTNWSTILTHTQVLGGGATIFPTTPTPVLHFRLRCSGLTLGLGTNIIATVLGTS